MARPTGTVTFLFTDIEGSTALLKRLGERYGDVLSQHRRIVRETFAAAGGSEIDTQGDAFFFAFPRARVARGGNVLMSETTRALVGSTLPDGVSVFPLGERHLKGLDEPERVYELEIEGVAQAAPPSPKPATKTKQKTRETDYDKRFERFGERLEERIQEGILRTLDRTLGRIAPATGGDDEAVEDIAERAASFDEKIKARVEASLRAAGVPPKPPGS